MCELAAAAAAALFLAWLPPCRPEEEEEAGEAAGIVAAVHVSVTGHSSLLTRVTPDGVVRMCPGGSVGFVRGGALLIGCVSCQVRFVYFYPFLFTSYHSVYLLIDTVAAAATDADDVEEVTAVEAFAELQA